MTLEPIVIAGRAGFTIARSYFSRLAARNDEIIAHERVELALEWGAELMRALPIVLGDLDARFEKLDEKVTDMLADEQLSRVYTNFTYEAAREAIDERRRLLAHAAVGLLNPELTVERKARIERTLRQLDPTDVLSLWGLSLIVEHGRDGIEMAQLLFEIESGAPLLASGCVQIRTVGGGAGVSASNGATITRTGFELLSVLRSYLASRSVPFEVPGRETGPNDRTEVEARRTLHIDPVLADLGSFLRRKSTTAMRFYRVPNNPSDSARMEVYLHDWRDWSARLASFSQTINPFGVVVELQTQPYQPKIGRPYEILRLTFTGPHDLLRHLADDFEAPWIR